MLRKIVSMALLCCCPLSALAASLSCGPHGKPAFTFEWRPTDRADPSDGSVRIKDASGRTVQMLRDLKTRTAMAVRCAPIAISITTAAQIPY